MKKRNFLSMLIVAGAMLASAGEANAQSSTSQEDNVPNVVYGKSDGTPSKINEIFYSDYVYYTGKVDKKKKTPSGKGELTIKQADDTSKNANGKEAYLVEGIFNDNHVTEAVLHIPGGFPFRGELSYEVYKDVVKFNLLKGELRDIAVKDNELILNINDYSFTTDMNVNILMTSEEKRRIQNLAAEKVRNATKVMDNKMLNVGKTIIRNKLLK